MVAQVDEALRLLTELLRAVVAGAPVVDDGRIEGRLVQLVLQEHAPAVGQRVVYGTHAVDVPLERAAGVHLPGEVAAVTDPDRERVRTERDADPDALDVVLDGEPPDGRVGMRQ